MLYQPMLVVLPKGLNEITIPEEMDQAFYVLFTESTSHVCLLKRYCFKEITIRCNFSMKKLKLEGLKFSFFCAIEMQNI